MNPNAYKMAYLLALNHKPMWAFFHGGTLLLMTESEQDAAECLNRYKHNGGKVKTETVGDVTAYICKG